jgi:putative transposase
LHIGAVDRCQPPVLLSNATGWARYTLEKDVLTPEQLENYFDSLGLSQEARQAIRLIRTSDPSRAVQSGPGNVSVRYASEKMGVTIQAESHTGELAAVYDWEHDDDVLEFWDQPPQILVWSDHKRQNGAWLITPDYFVLHKEWAGWVECKQEKKLQQLVAQDKSDFVNADDGTWHFPPGEGHASPLGLRFTVRSSKQDDWIVLRNLLLLHDYRPPNRTQTDPGVVRAAMQKVRQQPWWILRDFIHAEPAIPADTVFQLIADGAIFVDLQRELLAEPEVTHVFADRSAAVIHQSYLFAMTSAGPVPPAVVPIEAGQRLLWDGKPWVIFSATPERVTLKSPDGRFESPLTESFQELVRIGTVTCDDNAEEQRADARESALRAASPLDLRVANDRLYNLFPDLGDAGKKYCDRMLSKLRGLYRVAEDTLGNGFVGLLPRTHLRGNRTRKVKPPALAVMDEVIKEKLLDARRGAVFAAYGEMRRRCIGKGLAPPSEKTFRRQIKLTKRAADIVAATQGKKAAYAHTDFCWRLEHSTPRHGDMPYAVGHIDHTELDLQMSGRRFREKKMRLWLSVLIDAYTRKVLGYYLSFDKPSYRSCMCVIRDCVRRGHRVPSILVVDKGAEFLGGYFDTLLARLRVSKKVRPTAAGRFGSIVERFFGLTNQEFIHSLRGNTKASRDPRRMSPTHDPRVLAVWDIETFSDAFDGFIENGYGNLEHPALGMSPNVAMTQGVAMFGARKHRVEPYTREFILWTLPTTSKGKASVIPGRGVKINNIYYWSDDFKSPKLENTSIHVRYNPFDVSFGCAYIDGRWIDLASEYAGQFKGRSEREIKLISAEIRERQAKAHKRRNINAELIAAYMDEADQHERVLLQRMRDLEMQEGQQGSRAVPPAAEPADPPPEAEPEVSVSDAPDLPEPTDDEPWYDDDMLNEPLEPLKDFS